MRRASTSSAARRCSTATRGSKPNAPSLSKIPGLPAEETRDVVDRTLDVGRRRCLEGLRESPEQPCARRALARLGKLDADDAGPAPRDAALTDGRVEERETLPRHDRRDPSTD